MRDDKMKQINVRLHEDVIEYLKKLAKNRDMTFSDVIRESVQLYLQKEILRLKNTEYRDDNNGR